MRRRLISPRIIQSGPKPPVTGGNTWNTRYRVNLCTVHVIPLTAVRRNKGCRVLQCCKGGKQTVDKIQSVTFCTGRNKVATVPYTMKRKIQRSSSFATFSVSDSHNIQCNIFYIFCNKCLRNAIFSYNAFIGPSTESLQSSTNLHKIYFF